MPAPAREENLVEAIFQAVGAKLTLPDMKSDLIRAACVIILMGATQGCVGAYANLRLHHPNGAEVDSHTRARHPLGAVMEQ
jgi:hypothetical protein